MKNLGASLRDIAAMPEKEISAFSLPGKALSRIKSLPLFSAEKIAVKFKTDKTSGKNQGTVTFDLSVVKANTGRKANSRRNDACSFVVALGTPQNGFLLSHDSVIVSLNGQKKVAATRSVELTFDWALANACGGVNGGHIILRVLCADVKGMDVEYRLSLV